MQSIFDTEPYNQYRQPWAARCARYARNRAYHKGTAYDRLNDLTYTARLYEGTRTLFSPLQRAVRVDLAKVPAGWAMDEKKVSKATIERVEALRKATDAPYAYGRFALFGAVAGECAIMLSGTPQAPEISALRADEVVMGVKIASPLDVEAGSDAPPESAAAASGQVNSLGTVMPAATPSASEPFALIVKRETTTGHPYLGQTYSAAGVTTEYAMVITATTITTYKNGALFDYDGLGHTRTNAFGFIPVVFCQYLEGEDGCGEPAFGTVLELLDRINEIASLTLDTIARNAEPLLVGTGVSEINRDDQSDAILTEQKDAKFYTIDPNLAIAETLEFIKDVRDQYKTLLPQLRLDDLTGASDLAYETVLTLLMELGDHIVAVRAQIDRAIETIERWMLAGSGGIPEDYELHRDRRWMTLTESQQLDLEAKRITVEGQRETLEAQKSTKPLDLEGKRLDIATRKKALNAPQPTPGATAKE